MELIGYSASVLIGLSLGLIGGGGSILTVPILVYLFGMDALVAGSYSLFIVGITSLTGTFSHYRKGNVDLTITLIFGLPSLIAVFIMRKWVMPAIPQHLFHVGSFELSKPVLLMLTFGALMLTASYSMIKGRPEQFHTQKKEPGYAKLILQSLLVGLITGFVGVGGGFLIIPSLVFLAGLSMKKAVGTSLSIMTISSLSGFLGDLTRQSGLNYHFLSKFSAFAIAGILVGTYLSRYLANEKLKPAFGWFVLGMGTFILITTILKLNQINI
ncbi:sulfite exporter TauE/SafE family protein [Mucilaginibacter galii]|uniref:sulfite exporter TauE/SafE family protein n=1 Tax=Mucilaginibacter galii TaxID=2005073 RepID=UPI00166BEEBF|nr:sulfite exporter TauE/SafE family protein [Mucilaginibacter galii]